LFYHEASDGKHFLFPRGAHGPLARRDRRCSPKSPLGKLYRPGKRVKIFYFAAASAHTQRALHGAHRTRRRSGKASVSSLLGCAKGPLQFYVFRA
jgi:hypothetical protein